MKNTLRVAGGTVLLFALAFGAWAGTTYTLDVAEPLLDTAFYDGTAKGITPASASGRSAIFAQSSNSGTRVAFRGIDLTTGLVKIFVVDIGDPASWRQVTPEGFVAALTGPVVWSADDSFLAVDSQRIRVSDGAGAGQVFYDFEGVPIIDGSLTRKASDNFGVGLLANIIVGGPLLPNASLDPAGFGGLGPGGYGFTNFPLGVIVSLPRVAFDGDSIAFTVVTPSSDPLLESDVSDVYVLKGVHDIIAAGVASGQVNIISPGAPLLITDGRITPIRTTAEGSRFKSVPIFSEDSSLVVFGEDFNDSWSSLDPVGTIQGADFDVVLARADGTAIDGANDPVGAEADIRFAAAGNQLITGVTPGGLRILFQDDSLTTPGAQFRIYIATFIQETTVTGDALPAGPISTTVNGEPVTATVGDNAIQIPLLNTTDVVIQDSSGTDVVLPPGQVINYPSGAPQVISVSTPVNPVDVENVVLPVDAPADAIPVLRDFGPDGTEFFPPVEVTITYTDGEIAGLNEATLVVYLRDDDVSPFTAVPEIDIVARDLANNTITFKLAHFSQAGIGGIVLPMPVRGDWALVLLLGMLGVFALSVYGVSLRHAR